MRLAIELDGSNPGKYGVIHKAGCRDLRDAEPLGDATTMAEAQQLADDACGWGGPYDVSACVKFS